MKKYFTALVLLSTLKSLTASGQVYIGDKTGLLQKKTPAGFYNSKARMSTSTVAAGQDPSNLFPPPLQQQHTLVHASADVARGLA